MKLLEIIANALHWMLDSLFVPVALVVVAFLAILLVVGTAVVNKGDNPNITENKFKVACQAVSGAPVWNGKTGSASNERRI